MEDEKKIREPFSPENTPTPPQIIDPNERGDGAGGNEPVKTKHPSSENKTKTPSTRPAESPEKKVESGTQATEDANS